MGMTGLSVALSDGVGITLTAVGIALPITMAIALLAALSVAAESSGAAGPLVRSAGRSSRAVPPVVTGCAVAVIAAVSGFSHVALVAAAALSAVCLPVTTTSLVEIFSTGAARRRLQAAIAAGASPSYVAVVVHLRASARAVIAVALRTAARMSVETGALVVALAGVAGAERMSGGRLPAPDLSGLPFAVGQIFAAAVEPASRGVLERALALVIVVLALHAVARFVEGEPYASRISS
jgi:ABC-type phosphate transport system permease subunit